ncbi:MAG: hypothetical protein WCB68_11910 [Pyrinomonadaceae bacterium]
MLEKNYLYLTDLYKRGRFEDEIDEEQFAFFFEGRRSLDGIDEPKRGGRRNLTPAPIKIASEDLYELAQEIERTAPQAASDSIILMLRVKVLSYEIDDYFLDVDTSKGNFFLKQAQNIGEALSEFNIPKNIVEPDPLASYAKQHYPQIQERGAQRELIQQLILVALCGVNQMYRDHHDESYLKALPLAIKLRDYIQNDLPKLRSPERVSLGLLGLTLYMLGRLKLSLSSYDADLDFIASTECYANRVHEKEELHRQGKLSLAEYESTRLLTLRRSALVSAFGSGFLSLITSDLPAALKAIALARGIVKQNSGLVNSAYTDLLYCAVKRAQHSSDLNLLLDIRRTLRRCLGVFRRYVPNRHYEHRAGIELALVHHYIARANPRQERRSYALAEKYLQHAVEFAEREIPDKEQGQTEPARVDKPKRPRNMRLLAEALTILSYIIRHCSPHEMKNVTKAIELADRAILIAKDSLLYASEARIALGAAQVAKAEFLKGDEAAQKKELSNARVNFHMALVLNREANARLSAICYIRLGQICLLDKKMLGEARHWRDKWVGIKKQVHHEFCHQMGKDLEQSVERLGGITYLLIDPDESLNREYWREQLDNFLNNQAIYHVAKELRLTPTGKGGVDETATSSRTRGDLKKQLLSFLIDKMGIAQSGAYEWIRKHSLEIRLKELLRK